AVAKNVRLSIVASLEVFSCSLIDSELLPTSIFLTRNCRSDDAIVASRRQCDRGVAPHRAGFPRQAVAAPMMRCINCSISNIAVSINYHKGKTIVSERVQGSGSPDASPRGRRLIKLPHAVLPRSSTSDRVQQPGNRRQKTKRRKCT